MLIRSTTVSASFVLFLVIAFCANGPAQNPDLASRQTGVADRYQRLEELLLRMADVEAAENPERAALLRRAAKESREKFVLQQLRSAGDSLRNEKYSDAISNQDNATKGLSEILKLLTSEDRANRIRDEKERLAKLIKDLKRIERSQRGTRARTENGADIDDLEKEQEALADRANDLKSELAEEEEFDEQESTQSSDQSDATEDRDPKDQKNGESESAKEKSDKTDQPSEKKDNAAGDLKGEQGESDSGDRRTDEKQDGQGMQNPKSEDSQSQQSDSDQKPSNQENGQQSSDPSKRSRPQPKSPQQAAEQQLQDAIESMKQAEKELEDAKRDEAVEEQFEAEEKLRQAIDQLEQILRQLREEEMQRELARLESRLKKMAAMQSKLHEDTATLAETPKSQRNRQTDLRAGDLSFEQKKITVEADRAMLLLREEGSSVAFPEVVEQIRDDSDRVAQRLGKSQIDAVTQGIQLDVLAAIEEMIQALQQAQRDLEKQKQQGESPPMQAAQPGEQPLVGAISELKLIRTMEKRIKSTTQRYAGLLQSDDSSAQDLQPLFKNLSERQDRLYKITRDLLMRRNQ